MRRTANATSTKNVYEKREAELTVYARGADSDHYWIDRCVSRQSWTELVTRNFIKLSLWGKIDSWESTGHRECGITGADNFTSGAEKVNANRKEANTYMAVRPHANPWPASPHSTVFLRPRSLSSWWSTTGQKQSVIGQCD